LKNPISTYIQNWQANIAASIITGPAILLAFFFVSCEEPIEVEGDLVPGGNNTEIRYVEIPLEVKHRAFDSLLISSTNVNDGSRRQVFVGHQNSPEIGDFSAQAYFGALLDNETIRDSVKVGSQVIETKLFMDFNYFYGNDYNNSQQFKLYQLDNILQLRDGNYTIYDEINTDEIVSNDENTFLNPTDTIPDFINLKDNLGEKLLNLARNKDLNLEDTYDSLKGFKLEIEPGQNNLQALNLASGDSYFEVVYQSPTADTLQSVRFNLVGSSFTHIDFQPGSLIPNNYSEGKSFDLTDPSKAYFNNLLGISPILNLDPYLSFIDTVDYMKINKAELTIEDQGFNVVDNPSEQFRPIQNIVPYILNEEGNFSKKGEDFWAIQNNFNSNGAIANPNGGRFPASLSYDDNKKSIRGDISFFLQEIYNDPSFWEDENSIIFTGQFILRNNDPFIESPKINIGNFNSFLVNKENIKLKIYYTTFK